MHIWPFKARSPIAKSMRDDERLARQYRAHRVMQLFENMCTPAEKSAYMGELYRQGYQGGPVFTGVMWSACMKAAPDKLSQAERIIPPL